MERTEWTLEKVRKVIRERIGERFTYDPYSQEHVNMLVERTLNELAEA